MHEEFSCIGRCLFGDYCPRQGGLSGGLRGMLGAADVGGARRGGLPGRSPADLAVPESVGVACPLCRRLTLPFVFFLAPIPPPPSPAGKGVPKSLFRRGLRPRHPCIRPFAAFTNFSKQEPGAKGSPRFAARMARNAFLWTVPAAKERGDRGRWNYPSHATAAFEMVLSPGAGRTSAAGGDSFKSPPAFLPSPFPPAVFLSSNR